MTEPKFQRGDVIDYDSELSIPIGVPMLVVDIVERIEDIGYLLFRKDLIRQNWDYIVTNALRIDSIYNRIEIDADHHSLPRQIETALETMNETEVVNAQI